jgi:hypothetical protein
MNAAEVRIEFIINVLNSDQKEYMDELFEIYQEEKKREISRKISTANKKRKSKWWFDGICNKCGSKVIETAATKKDYMNGCSNKECPEYKLHYCYDTEELDYYTHKRS